MRSVAVLIVRLVVGGLMAGHGAQKLFGAFGGAGLRGTAGWMESLRLRPGTAWARMAGGSELGGGLLTMLGLLNPLGPIAAIGAMGMAWAKVHLGKPVWSTKGGAELPLINIAVFSAMSIAGPGKLSLDSLLGIRIPRWIGFTALASVLGAIWLGARRELEAGTSDVAESGAEVEGDPSPSPDDQAEMGAAGSSAAGGAAAAGDTGEGSTADAAGSGVGVEDPMSADTAGGGYQFDGPEAEAANEERDRGAAAGALAGSAFASSPFAADPSWAGTSGADAGTSMGTGSELGSETGEDSV